MAQLAFHLATGTAQYLPQKRRTIIAARACAQPATEQIGHPLRLGGVLPQGAKQHRQNLPQGALHLLGACTQLLRHLLHRSPLQLCQEFFAQIHIRHLLISYSLRGQAVCSKRYGGMNA